ncbi:MAG: hypothetical protein WAO28_01085 [Candidatus Microsaccharimonas sp.]
MLIPKGDGTFTSGPLDIILIYHNVEADTFHPAFYREHGMPGPPELASEQDFVRLMSDKHHTDGLPTLEEAQEFVRTTMQPTFGVPDRNIVLDPPYPWHGQIGDVMIVQNWLKVGPDATFREVNVNVTT